jgi:hypothetical protein
MGIHEEASMLAIGGHAAATSEGDQEGHAACCVCVKCCVQVGLCWYSKL